jgi:hypothetical protein
VYVCCVCVHMYTQDALRSLWLCLLSCLSIWQVVKPKIGCEGMRWPPIENRESWWPGPILSLLAVACLLSPGCNTRSPIFHVRGFVPRSPSPASLGRVSLIYFRLDLHALHTDYHLADSSFAYFFCLICSGFITQALQPILVLLGLWECQN